MTAAVLAAVEQLTRETGYPPTERQIARLVGLAPSTVHDHLARLEAQGHIARSPDSRKLILVLGPSKAERPSERLRTEVCANCRVPFTSRRRARYCSDACRAEHWRKEHAA